MRRLWSVPVLLGLFSFAGVGVAQDGGLTLDEVIRLHAAGTSADALIERIESSGSAFALDGPAIERVKRANLSPRVMVALMKAGQKRKTEPEPTAASPGAGNATAVPEAGAVPEEPARPAGETGAANPETAVSGFAEFRQTEGRFSIQFPAGWKVCTLRNGRSTVKNEAFELAFLPPDEADDLGRVQTFFMITFLPRRPEAAQPELADWLKAYRQRLQMLEPGYTLGEGRLVELAGGARAATLGAEGVPRGGTDPLKVVFYGVIEPDGFFLLRHGAPTAAYPQLEETFARMAPTFTLRPAIPSPANGDSPGADLLAARTEPFDPGSSRGGADGAVPAVPPTVSPASEEPPTARIADAAPSPASEPVDSPPPVDAPQTSFVEFAEPDGRFRIQFPAGWKRADLATATGVAYYFSPRPYDPRDGKPFSTGVCVTVQPNVYGDAGASEEIARLATTGDAVRQQFVLTQEEARSLVRVHDPSLLKLGGTRPALVYRYTLTYPNGGDELGFLIVAVHGVWIVVAEGNAPREDYAEVQSTLLQVAESLVLPE